MNSRRYRRHLPLSLLLLLGCLALPAEALATTLPLSYARHATRDYAKQIVSKTRDAKGYGVSCKRRDPRRVQCKASFHGRSLDNHATFQPWRCSVGVLYTLTKRSGQDYQGLFVKGEFSKQARCSGPGAPYIQRTAAPPG